MENDKVESTGSMKPARYIVTEEKNVVKALTVVNSDNLQLLNGGNGDVHKTTLWKATKTLTVCSGKGHENCQLGKLDKYRSRPKS